jgi:hypothetical protein
LLEAIKAAIYDYDIANEKRTMDAQFRGDRTSLKVVKLRPNDLFLNHKNSRIMVELESHPDYDSVINDPTSVRSQLILETLLRATPAYETIRDEVKEFKQREPGTISVDGRVINGNTRLVALRELGWDGFDAGVLPENATDEDFKEIELGLQLVEFTKQRYSFVNRLRQFEMMLPTRPTDEICRLMGWQRDKLKKFDEFKLILDLLNEYAERGIPKVYFNSKEEYMKDLAARVQSLTSQGKLDEVASLKGLRLLGMLGGNSKDEVRNIDVDFVEKYMRPRAESAPAVVALLVQESSGDDKDDKYSELFPPTRDAHKDLIDEVIELYGREPDGETFVALSDVLRLAGDDAVQDKRRTSRNELPIQMLVKVHSDINQTRAKLKELADKGEISSVDTDVFENSIEKVTQALRVLALDFEQLNAK